MAGTADEPVIVVEDAGIEFKRNRRSRRSFKDLFAGNTRRKRPVTRSGPCAMSASAFAPVRGDRRGGPQRTRASRRSSSWSPRSSCRTRTPSKVHGGVAPLIEITGGFVDDLTVRDNVYLTAGLHGMSNRQIASRFDEIIGFAELGKFMDTPYKHLSSGMKVRLAFSVISRLEEPIILVDEVLAVGDKAFREKCYRRIEELLAGGRTLFFVSHNERDLRRFCQRGLYLDGGALVLDARHQRGAGPVQRRPRHRLVRTAAPPPPPGERRGTS